MSASNSESSSGSFQPISFADYLARGEGRAVGGEDDLRLATQQLVQVDLEGAADEAEVSQDALARAAAGDRLETSFFAVDGLRSVVGEAQGWTPTRRMPVVKGHRWVDHSASLNQVDEVASRLTLRLAVTAVVVVVVTLLVV